MKTALAIFLLLTASLVFAQEAVEEELVVTGFRKSLEDSPGVVLKKKGDSLLLKILLTNDTREQEQREKEIYDTLLNSIALAKKNSRFKVSVIQNGFVVPLTKNNFRIDLAKGD